MTPKFVPVAVYYSSVVVERLKALADAYHRGDADASVCIAQQHAAILGLALDDENGQSLMCSMAELPRLGFASSTTKRLYSVELSAGLTHIIAIQRDGGATPHQVIYTGTSPFSSGVYNPSNNDWLDAPALAPLLSRKYTYNKRRLELRDVLRQIAATPAMVTNNDKLDAWLLQKGLQLFSAQGNTILVQLFPHSDFANAHAVLAAAGSHATAEVLAYAGEHVKVSPIGETIPQLTLHCSAATKLRATSW